MENEILKKSPGCIGVIAVFMYEAYATCMLVYAVCMNQDAPIAIPLTLLAMILIIGPLTGGHVNPAVSIGTFIQHIDKFGSNILWLLIMVCGQICGGLLGTAAFLMTTAQK